MANKQIPIENQEPRFVNRSSMIVGEEYVLLLGEIKKEFRKAQIKSAVRVNTGLLEFYWEMGRKISRLQTQAKWGSAFFDSLSLDLKAEFPNQTGFSSRNIRYVVQWYEFYNQHDIILHQVGAKIQDSQKSNLREPIAPIHQYSVDELEETNNQIHQRATEDFEMPIEFGKIPWKHHVLIFTKSKSVKEAIFYIDETIKNGWSRNALEDRIDNDLYAKRGKVITNFDEKLPNPYGGLAKDLFKSEYDFSFIKGAIESERELEDALARDITRFLLELGHGFAYVGRQMQLEMPGGKTYIPDMIFYNFRLKSFIICELKNTEFKPEYVGKLNFYVSAVDELLKGSDDNPSIGLLICKSKKNIEVEWAFRGMTQPLGVASFERRVAEILPTAEQLQKLIETYHLANGNRED